MAVCPRFFSTEPFFQMMELSEYSCSRTYSRTNSNNILHNLEQIFFNPFFSRQSATGRQTAKVTFWHIEVAQKTTLIYLSKLLY
jgi:hypothetical protein